MKSRKAAPGGEGMQETGPVKAEDSQPQAPASLPAGAPPSREWWEQEAARIRAELAVYTAKPKPEDRWYVLRLRGQLMKLHNLLGKAALTAPPAKPVESMGAFIDRMNADPAARAPELEPDEGSPGDERLC
jgi:hypothetical protein